METATETKNVPAPEVSHVAEQAPQMTAVAAQMLEPAPSVATQVPDLTMVAGQTQASNGTAPAPAAVTTTPETTAPVIEQSPTGWFYTPGGGWLPKSPFGSVSSLPYSSGAPFTQAWGPSAMLF